MALFGGGGGDTPAKGKYTGAVDPSAAPPLAPPNLTLDGTIAAQAAADAANKARKKALGGATLLDGPNNSTQTPATASLSPKTLLGY